MTYRQLSTVLLALVFMATPVHAADNDYKTSKEYLSLRDSVHRAFNAADSMKFFTYVKQLESYLMKQDDMHAYYTQRCNEIVFLLNRQCVFEAYKKATQLSKELTERRLEKEMYMAINMMGHIYRYCGDKESAKKCFWEVIKRMEKEGYDESIPPIYMNLVSIYENEDPAEALRLIDKAAEVARNSSPERLFDIESRRTLVYYNLNDIPHFMEGYKAYREGVEQGLTSVHGRKLEIYHQVLQGNTEEALRLATETEDDPYETISEVYAKAGRWKEAYKYFKLGAAKTDSINSEILSNSMQGIQHELQHYEMKRREASMWFYGLLVIVSLLGMLVIALVYIVQSRRCHLKELKIAYEHALEADKMKTAFIQNVTHEVRTPLNVISGFAQVLAESGYDLSAEERRNIADTMQHNTYRITTLINEVLEMSKLDASATWDDMSEIPVNDELHRVIGDFRKEVQRTEENLQFVTTLDDSFMFRSQEGVLGRMLTPLLDNAVKSTPEGIVTLRAETNGKQLVLTVEDQGIGIPAEKAEQIFERFFKLDSFTEGLGLGLTYSRVLARRMGGEVKLDTSYQGPGARFVVTLPIKK